MSQLSEDAKSYLLEQLLRQRPVLYLRIAKGSDHARCVSGDPLHFGLVLAADDTVDVAALTIGLDPSGHGLQVSKAQIAHGASFDLHQLLIDGERFLLLIDVDDLQREVQQAQQSSNEARLRLDEMSERERLLHAEHKALRESSEEMQRHQHVQSEFVRRLSHEFGTPISAVLGHLNLMDLPTTTAEQSQRSLSAVRRGVAHLRQLVESVLDQARLQNNQFELYPGVTNLATLADDFRELHLGTALQRGLDWHVSLDAHGCVEVLIDELRLRQILLNLISNAFKFTEQGKVSLSLRWHDAVLTADVVDSGPGMSAAEQARLFADYGRSARGVRGTGLGLSISREIVQRMGGTLRLADSTLGRGSRFVLDVPAPIVRGQPEDNQSLNQPQQVLVVDDDEDLRLLLVAMLEQLGCAASAVAGLADVRLDAEPPPDVAVVDMHLGRLDGSVVLQQLRKSWPNAYLLALSADSSQDVLERSRRAGADSFLLKPLEPGALSLALQVAVQRRAAE